MSEEHKNIHMITELLAVIILIPFFIRLLYVYKFKYYDRLFLMIIIFLTFVIDGSLFFTWL